MKRAGLFAVGVVVPAILVVLSLLVTRWGFRAWPAGSYVWIPILDGVASAAVLLLLACLTGSRGLPFMLLVLAWYVGRVAGAFACAIIPDVGVDPALVASGSFGIITWQDGTPGTGWPSPLPAVVPLLALATGHVWGKRREIYPPARRVRPPAEHAA